MFDKFLVFDIMLLKYFKSISINEKCVDCRESNEERSGHVEKGKEYYSISKTFKGVN